MELISREMRCGSWTDKGVRRRNEDCVDVDRTQALLVIADGMGGHPCGDEASQAAVASVLETLRNAPHPERHLREAVLNAHDILSSKGDNRGSTLTLARISDRYVYIAHVGDCRMFVDGKQITIDQGIGEMLNDFLGGTRIPRVAMYKVELREGSWLVMTSDGVHDIVPVLEQMPRLIRESRGQPEEIARQLTTLALRSGSTDNCTSLVAQITGHGFNEPAP